MTSNSVGTYDDLRQTINSYLLIKILSVKNLSQIIDSYKLQPYITMSLGTKQWETLVGTLEKDVYYWEEVFQIDLDSKSPLVMALKDKDEFGTDTLLQKFVFEVDMFNEWQEKKLLNLKLETLSDDETEVTGINLYDTSLNQDSEPILQLEITYMDAKTLGKLKAQIISHRNIIRNKKAFTLYEVWLTRNDGVNWKIELRYSEFVLIRSELSKVLKSIKTLPFPSKTYFHWLSGVFGCTSRFSEQRIAERKTALQNFLNLVLDNQSEYLCDTVTNLLKLPSPL
jgi:PX domain/C2 domain